MNVLFLTIGYPEGNETNLYTDLIQEFEARGDNVYVVCPRERRVGKQTELQEKGRSRILRVKTYNLTKTNVIEKTVAMLMLESQFVKAIKKYFSDITFDLVIYSTPPITFAKVVQYVKTRDGSKSYLLLKDIFPQNAVDMGMFKKNGLVWRYFRKKEERLYAVSDHIGCMSKGNVEYLLRHNPEIDRSKVEECPNSIKVRYFSETRLTHKQTVRAQLQIPEDAVVFVYGGNLGRPQGLDFFLDVLDELRDRQDLFFLISGSGTEYEKIRKRIDEAAFTNVKLFKAFPKEQYNQILECCDVGLIFLDARFTIPNIPSRLNSYLEYGVPIAAATDDCTDLMTILEEADCGVWAKSGDKRQFIKQLEVLARDENLRKRLGRNGRIYLERNYTVARSYEIIKAHTV
ncbi:glycosyltransferase family 4 protein [Cohnella yongneupensis]|uniref:Glycosyltransferase family 4 protein n=1 Tax=Cohnella yongneupensis TaxID=425006 RepID=A0ABW0R5A4_9BACL